MSREQEIDETIEYVHKLWKANPEARLLQLLMLPLTQDQVHDWPYILDDELVRALERYIENGVYKRGE